MFAYWDYQNYSKYPIHVCACNHPQLSFVCLVKENWSDDRIRAEMEKASNGKLPLNWVIFRHRKNPNEQIGDRPGRCEWCDLPRDQK